ncbi:MAG: Cys-tRNA(Pro) deacylase [Gammaproteobacteria bacterium]
MTPAINLANKSGIAHQVHEYQHDPASASYGLEAATKLGVPPQRVFKTLVVRLDDASLAVAVVPVATQLNMKLMARAAGAKKAGMADKADVERATGYVLGGVSPLGQKKRLPTYIDTAATAQGTIFVSAGRRGLEIELSPQDLKALTQGHFAELCPVGE